MKALLSVAPGGPETLVMGELARPVPGPGEISVRVVACGINYPDVLIIEDKYQVRPDRPFAPGTEIAGTVAALGPGVEGWQVGERVIAAIGHGGLVETVLVPVARAIRLPDWADIEAGAALLMTYATTYHALVDRGGLQAGETLLVLGAAGGTGLAAVEIGKALGVRVVAACSTPKKAAAARRAGADEAMVYPGGGLDKAASKELAGAFKAAVGGEGAHVVYDPVGGDYCDPAVRALRWGGRYLVVGFTAGIARLPLNLALLKSADIRGVFWGEFIVREPEHNRDNVAKLFEMWREGRIRPRVERAWPLAEGGEAIAWLRDRKAVGKAVVRI